MGYTRQTYKQCRKRENKITGVRIKKRCKKKSVCDKGKVKKEHKSERERECKCWKETKM